MFGCLGLGIVDLKAQLFACEACAVDQHINTVNAVRKDLEESLAVYRSFCQSIYHFQRFWTLYSVHLPVFRYILVVHVQFSLVGVKPDEHISAEECRDPVALFIHTHDNHVIDDLSLVIKHRGVALTAYREIANGLREHQLQKFSTIPACDFHNLMCPQIPAYRFTYSHMLGTLHFIIAVDILIHNRIRIFHNTRLLSVKLAASAELIYFFSDF